MKICKYFPGFTPKAITFSIDDGSVVYDKIFLDIVRPAGIKGTFNLFPRAKSEISDDELRARYSGYEISNHCKRHPFAFNVEKEYAFSDDPFDPETADKNLVYKGDREGVYRIYHRSYWATIAENDAYLKLAAETKEELEEVFGKGSVKGFVWPFGQQKNPELFEALKKEYPFIRKAFSESFDLPLDRMAWGVNATSSDFETKILEFEALDDDGELKFFCFGLHSVDFERQKKWDALKSFAKEYGNRPTDFWYASVGDIFEYEDAINAIKITEKEIINPTDKELYITLDGKRYILLPDSTSVIA
ncbi:MAG: polysaccharide deacetylase family protein [Clostridia bacterium]|nr:polysaccharide deacetylase family protein [Clostridia bacterium]